MSSSLLSTALRKSLFALGVLAVLVPPAFSEVLFYGMFPTTTGWARNGSSVTYTNFLPAQKAAGVDIGMGYVWVPADYTMLTQEFSAIQSSFTTYNTVMMLDLTNLLFESHTSGTFDCSPYGGSSTFQALSSHPKSTLRSDWQSRLNSLASAIGSSVNPGNTPYIVVHAEVNNHCIPPSELDQATDAVRTKFPDIDLGGLYEIEPRASIGAQGLPTQFPDNMDWISFFIRDIYDPNNPSDPRNLTDPGVTFFNPSNETDPATLWGDFLSRLRGPFDGSRRQRVVLAHVAWGLLTDSEEAASAQLWYDWAASQDPIEGVFSAGWQGISQQPLVLAQVGDMSDSAKGSAVFSETFSRSNDPNLNGDSLESDSSVAWAANNMQVYGSQARPGSASNTARADIPINATGALSVSIEAELLAKPSNRVQYLGFPNTTNGLFGNIGSTLWLEVNHAGSWAIKNRHGGVTYTLATGSLSGFVSGTKYLYRLVYEPGSPKRVSFYFNGSPIPVVHDVSVPKPVSLGRVGFQFSKTSGTLGTHQAVGDDFHAAYQDP